MQLSVDAIRESLTGPRCDLLFGFAALASSLGIVSGVKNYESREIQASSIQK